MLFSTQRPSKLNFLTLLSGTTDFNLTVSSSPWIATQFFLYLEECKWHNYQNAGCTFPLCPLHKKSHNEKVSEPGTPPWVMPQLHPGLIIHGVYGLSC